MISFLFALAMTVQPGELYYDELGCMASPCQRP